MKIPVVPPLSTFEQMEIVAEAQNVNPERRSEHTITFTNQVVRITGGDKSHDMIE